jgi:flavin reductase
MIPDSSLFKLGMRRLAVGVSIVTTFDAGERHGMAATSVCSVSAEPPALLVCVNRAATTHAVIRRAGFFCINLLAKNDDELARRFSTPADRSSRFLDRQWTTLVTQAPVLVGALASFDCEVIEAVDIESHTVFIGRVKAIELWHEDIVPLVYHDGRFDTLRGQRQIKDRA